MVKVYDILREIHESIMIFNIEEERRKKEECFYFYRGTPAIECRRDDIVRKLLFYNPQSNNRFR